jgi:hypothetical protein
MNACVGKQLYPGRKSPESLGFEGGLQRKIVGQDEAVQAVVALVPGGSCRAEIAWAAGRELAVPWADRCR